MLGYVCLGFINKIPEIYEDSSVDIIAGPRENLQELPSWLARPWISVSEKLGRRPMLDYAGCVLNNWERIDPEGPVTPSNVRLLRRFTGLVDEEWFFKTHIIIEAEGSHVVSSLEAISKAMASENWHNLLQALRSLEEALWRLTSVCLPIMFARSPEDRTLLCEPFLFYFRLRNYIKSLDVRMEGSDGELREFHLHGPSGAMSTILPSVDAALGIRNTSAELREAVKNFEMYVPRAHRDFLNKLRNAPQSVKTFIETRKGSMDENTWFAMAGAYNSCISRVLDFRWKHWSFVEQFIVRPSSSKTTTNMSACPVMDRSNGKGKGECKSQIVGTGGTTFDYLQQHITDSQRARIQIGSVADVMKTPELTPLTRGSTPLLPKMPLLESSLWDPTGRNGFATLRMANLPNWGPLFHAPLPGCSALLELASVIPTLCYTHPGLEHMENSSFAHPFVTKCEEKRLEIESLIKPSKDGTPAENLPVADLEQTWLVLTMVVAAYGSSRRPPMPKASSRCPAMAAKEGADVRRKEKYAVWVYTEGSSPLLPAMHAILGLKKLDGISGPLQEHWQTQGRRCMPKNHRLFLDGLEQSMSVRAYCLREWRCAPVECIAALEDSFNNCIEALLRYCSLRERLVNRMFSGTARIRQLSSEQEQVIRSGRMALLQMRRIADSRRMLLLKPPPI
ncbi:unnamed protein product [Effrenium voratum]|nr:unnamed protein product [Effrenium voratum]